MAVKLRNAFAVAGIIMLLLCAVPVYGNEPASGSGSAEPVSIRIEQVQGRLPEAKVYFFAPNAKELTSGQMSAAIDGKEVSVVRLQPFKDSGEGTRYIFLVDVSTSILDREVQAVRETLTGFSEELDSKDRLVLLSFGKEVTTLLTGTESAAARADAIKTLDNKSDGTKFYDAVKNAVEIAENRTDADPERTVAVVITDGEDYDKGGYTKNEVENALEKGNLPLYALGWDHYYPQHPEYLSNLAEMSRSGGAWHEPANGFQFHNTFIKLMDIASNPYVLSLKTGNNVIGTAARELSLKLRVNGATISGTKQISLEEYVPDTEAPSVLSVTQLENQEGIRIDFSEALLGADDKANYRVAEGKTVIAIQSVSYVRDGESSYADVIFTERPYTGNYTLTFNGITDDSMEKNRLADTSEFSYLGTPASQRITHLIFVQYWWLIFTVFITVLLVVVFLILRKRKGLVKVNGKIGFGESVEFQHHFETPETSPISLIVTDMKGEAYKVALDLNKSIFVGRQKINNLSFDDTKMSRQHFVIEVDDGEYYITDLQTTNGTFLNGVQISGRRKLENNDVITAGNEKFVFKAEN